MNGGAGAPRRVAAVESWYLSWPEMLLESYERALDAIEEPVGEGGVLVCGMGGSGYVADVMAAVAGYGELSPAGVEVAVAKSHMPPRSLAGHPVVVGVSYSGETIETIECVREAVRRGARPAAVTSPGSSLWRLVSSLGGTLVPVVDGLIPRAALASMVGGLLALLYGPGAATAVRLAAELMAERRGEVAGLARRAGSMFVKGIPVVGACGAMNPAARRWVQELAENAKLHGIAEEYPEAGHNLVMSWSSMPTHRFTFLLVKGATASTDAFCASLEDVVEEIYSSHGSVVVHDLRRVRERSLLAALLLSGMAAGVGSVAAARARGIDPVPTDTIVTIKRRLYAALKSAAPRGAVVARGHAPRPGFPRRPPRRT